MKKGTVILISIVLVVSFLGLAYYGLSHARGAPVATEKPETVTIEVPFIDTDIDLSNGISPDQWDAIPSEEVELVHQVMVLPWGRDVNSPVAVKAFHNGKDVYFFLEWKDGTENRSTGVGEFPDASAIMFPVGDEPAPPTIMMGFLGRANIWQWKASQDGEYWSEESPETRAYADYYYPFEAEELFPVSRDQLRSANDLVAEKAGTVTVKETQNVEGRGVWDEEAWRVVFKRSLEPVDPDLDAAFDPAGRTLCAFALWNGADGDRGGRKSISDWVEMEVKVEE